METRQKQSVSGIQNRNNVHHGHRHKYCTSWLQDLVLCIVYTRWKHYVSWIPCRHILYISLIRTQKLGIMNSRHKYCQLWLPCMETEILNVMDTKHKYWVSWMIPGINIVNYGYHGDRNIECHGYQTQILSIMNDTRNKYCERGDCR